MTARPILLDTCAAVFLNRGKLSAGAESALNQAQIDGVRVFLSPITAWELGLLVSRGRLALKMSPAAWFQEILDAGADLAELTPRVLVESSFLPGPSLRDPADRSIAATARAHGYRLMTRDQPLLEYAAAGHVAVIAC